MIIELFNSASLYHSGLASSRRFPHPGSPVGAGEVDEAGDGGEGQTHPVTERQTGRDTAQQDRQRGQQQTGK